MVQRVKMTTIEQTTATETMEVVQVILHTQQTKVRYSVTECVLCISTPVFQDTLIIFFLQIQSSIAIAAEYQNPSYRIRIQNGLDFWILFFGTSFIIIYWKVTKVLAFI